MSAATGSAASEPSARRLRRDYGNAVAVGLILSVLLHVGLFEVVPRFQVRQSSHAVGDIEAVELPPEVEVPPPPEATPRPAQPVVAEADISEEVTISPTTFQENPVDQLPPPPKARGTDPEDRPTFIPRDVDPRATNDAEITRLLRKLYPPPLRNAGIGGTVTLWLFVNRDGQIGKTRVQESSGYEAFHRAAAKVARQMEFQPALSRDRPIGVWVSRRIAFNVQQ